MIAVLPLLAVSAVGDERLPAFAVPAEERAEGAGDRQRAVDGRASDLPPLFDDGQFAADLFDDPTEARLAGIRAAEEFDEDDAVDRASDLEAAAKRLEIGRRAGRAAISAGFRRAARTSCARQVDRRGRATARSRAPSTFPSRRFCSTRRKEKSRLAARAGRARAATLGSRRSSARICWPAACRRTSPGRSS